MSRHKTPLRYPGGKQKLAPFIREIIETNDLLGGEYIEPYAGGAGVAVDLLLGGIVKKIHLNDASKHVHAFWQSILNETDRFCEKLVSASLTVAEWNTQRAVFMEPRKHSRFDVGFSTFFLNRCNRSGIFNAGVIGGKEQNGPWKIDARFPTNDLIHRIESIAIRKSCITLRNWDADRFLLEYIPRLPEKSLVYFDPPYFAKADRLYLHHYSRHDHERIAELIQSSVKIPWIVSYDNAPEIIEYYSKRNRFEYELQYTAGPAYKGKELFVFGDGVVIPTNSSVDCINRGIAAMVS